MGRRKLLKSHERPAVFGLPTDDDSLVRHYTLSPSDLLEIQIRRRAPNQLGFAVQLCLMRYPGRTLMSGESLPLATLEFIARQLDIEPDEFHLYARREPTRMEHVAFLLTYLGMRTPTFADRRVALSAAIDVAAATDRGTAIINAIVAAFRERNVLLPTEDVIERLGLAARAIARRRAEAALLADFPEVRLVDLDDLLSVDPEIEHTRFHWIRSAPDAPRGDNLIGLMERLAFIRSLEIDPQLQNRVHPERWNQMVREGDVTPAWLVADFNVARRRATIVTQLIKLTQKLTDDAVTMFCKLIGRLFSQANNRKKQRRTDAHHETAKALRLFRDTLRALVAADQTGADALDIIDRQVGWYKLLQAKPLVEAMVEDADPDPLSLAIERYGSVRKYAPMFLQALTFRSARRHDPLLAALDMLKLLSRDGRRALPARFPVGHLREQTRKLISGQDKPDRRLYEIATLAVLRDRLRSADVWVEGSRSYRPMDELLMPMPTFRTLKEDGDLGLGVQSDGAAYLSEAARVLDFNLRQLAHRARNGKLDGVRLEHGKLLVTPLSSEVPTGAEELNWELSGMYPLVEVPDLLKEVHEWTRFADQFTHVRTGEPPRNISAMLAAALADGTNLGPKRMAIASKGISAHQISWMRMFHARAETYRTAQASISDAHSRHPHAQLWGNGATASSDGQFFRASDRAAKRADINPHYGSEPGTKFYSHLSDQYGYFSILPISPTESEAAYVLDGLFDHEAALDTKEHFTDTGGASDNVFALFALLDKRFSPRLRNLNDRKLHTFEKPGVYSGLENHIGTPINSDLILAHWDELLHLAASIKMKVVAPSAILKKLAASPNPSQLAKALRELGRLERSLFMIEWYSSPALRRRCQAGLNKGEAAHKLKRAVFFHERGETRDRSFESQAFRASGLNLVVSAIVHWNTVYLSRAVQHLRQKRRIIPNEMLKHVSPLSWEHINLTGIYTWDEPPSFADSGFRPLRTSTAIAQAA